MMDFEKRERWAERAFDEYLESDYRSRYAPDTHEQQVHAILADEAWRVAVYWWGSAQYWRGVEAA